MVDSRNSGSSSIYPPERGYARSDPTTIEIHKVFQIKELDGIWWITFSLQNRYRVDRVPGRIQAVRKGNPRTR